MATTITPEPSPNANSKIYAVSGRRVLPASITAGMQFTSVDAARAASCGLAEALLGLPTTTLVFVGPTWVSVNSVEGTDWDMVLAAVTDAVDAAESGVASEEDPLYSPPEGLALEGSMEDGDYDSEDEEIVEEIVELLETMVRPTVQADGGDIFFVGYRDDVVRVRLAGSCDGCAMSTETLQLGVERLITHYVPSVKRVEAVENTPLDLASDAAFEKLEASLGGRA